MISSTTLHVGPRGSTHSLQQIGHPRGVQHQSSDSPQFSHRQPRHDTIVERGESACSDDNQSVAADKKAAAITSEQQQQQQQQNQDHQQPQQQHPKKGFNPFQKK